jgi:hypothetical protein
MLTLAKHKSTVLSITIFIFDEPDSIGKYRTLRIAFRVGMLLRLSEKQALHIYHVQGLLLFLQG